MILQEVINKKSLLTSFAKFFSAYTGETDPNVNKNILNIIIETLFHFINFSFEKLIKDAESDEVKDVIKDIKNYLFDNNTIKRSFLENFIPNTYMEFLLKSLKNSFTIKGGLGDLKELEDIKNRTGDDTLSDLFIAISLLIIFKAYAKKTGTENILSDEIKRLESFSFSSANVSSMIESSLLEIINTAIHTKKERERIRPSNYLVFSNDEIEVYKVDSEHKLCVFLGKGTRWCVSSDNEEGLKHFNYYKSEGDMYAFIFKNIPNSYDHKGPEKALLTIRRKTDGDFDFMTEFKKYLGEFGLKPDLSNMNIGFGIGIYEGDEIKDYTKEIFELIDLYKNDSDFIEYLESNQLMTNNLNIVLNNKEFYEMYRTNRDEIKSMEELKNYMFERMKEFFSKEEHETLLNRRITFRVPQNADYERRRFIVNMYNTLKYDHYYKLIEYMVDFSKFPKDESYMRILELFEKLYNKFDSIDMGVFHINLRINAFISIDNKVVDKKKFLKNLSEFNKVASKYQITNPIFSLKDSSNNDIPQDSHLFKLMRQWPEFDEVVKKILKKEYYYKLSGENFLSVSKIDNMTRILTSHYLFTVDSVIPLVNENNTASLLHDIPKDILPFIEDIEQIKKIDDYIYSEKYHVFTLIRNLLKYKLLKYKNTKEENYSSYISSHTENIKILSKFNHPFYMMAFLNENNILPFNSSTFHIFKKLVSFFSNNLWFYLKYSFLVSSRQFNLIIDNNSYEQFREMFRSFYEDSVFPKSIKEWEEMGAFDLSNFGFAKTKEDLVAFFRQCQIDMLDKDFIFFDEKNPDLPTIFMNFFKMLEVHIMGK